METLTSKRCVPCEGGVVPLEGEKLLEYMHQLGGGWKSINEHHIEKEFTFTDFREALHFTNKIGALAEKEGHHPDIHLTYGRVRVILWTHTINGLSENDFILAAKCDEIAKKLKV